MLKISNSGAHLCCLWRKSVKKNCIQKLHSWIFHCIGFRLKHRTLKFRYENFLQKGILGTEFKKQLSFFEVSGQNLEFELATVEFRISISEYSFVPSFILNKAIWSFESKYAQKRYCRDRIKKKLFLNSKSATLNTLLYRVSF